MYSIQPKAAIVPSQVSKNLNENRIIIIRKFDYFFVIDTLNGFNPNVSSHSHKGKKNSSQRPS